MKILITGGAGFIGHHMVDYVLQNTDWDIVVLDRLDLSGNLNRLTDLESLRSTPNMRRLKFVWHDLKSPISEFVGREIGQVDHVIHLAASSHVDRSIEDPVSFAMDNVVGTTNLLVWAKTGMKKRVVGEEGPIKAYNKYEYVGKFINFSTDEVFGPAEPGINHKENEPHYCSNPYSASKSGQGAMGYAFYVTYGLPVITTYTMNNYGERQHPEKLIPKAIRSVIEGTPMPIFAEVGEDGELHGVGSRFWLHSWNTASAVLHILAHGKAGESYNVVGFDELTNLEVCQKVADIIGKPLIPEFVDFHKTRPGHDRRYSLDGTKLKELGWKPEISFEEGLKKVVDFTLTHPNWQ
jgi:dTDP-glucose 4,6-dehydratase